MKKVPAALLAARLLWVDPAAGAPAQAAAPFPEIPLGAPAKASHKLAYLTLFAGAGLLGASFAFAKQADATYDDYLASTDPDEITRLYDETIRYDRLSSASLLSGEVLVATGLYLRFLRPRPAQRMGLLIGPRLCALSLRF